MNILKGTKQFIQTQVPIHAMTNLQIHKLYSVYILKLKNLFFISFVCFSCLAYPIPSLQHYTIQEALLNLFERFNLS